MKKVGLICAALLVCGSLAACGNQSTKKASSSSKANSKVVKKHKKHNNKKQSESSNKNKISSKTETTSTSSNADLSDPRVQALIQKGLLNPDGTPTRKGRDLNAMVEGKNLPESDWDSSDYTEAYDDEHGAYRVPIYGNQQDYVPNTNQGTNNSGAGAASTAPGTNY
mgnify:CR=1 FL=1|jgi:hypothetical protein